jgi:hypothetical protein
LPAVALLVVGIALTSEVFNWRQDLLGHGAGSKVLDTRLWYTPDDVRDFLHEIGLTGRQLYLVTQLSVDLLFPAMYGLLCALLLVRLWGRMWGGFFAAVALAAAASDVVENLCTAVLAATFEGQSSWLALPAVLATLAKFGLTFVALVAIVGGSVYWFARHRSASNQAS